MDIFSPKFLNSMLIAMEAEDITTDTANEVRSAIGGETPSTQLNPTDSQDAEDLSKVDDIFGIEEEKRKSGQSDGPSGNPSEDSDSADSLDEEEPTEDTQSDDSIENSDDIPEDTENSDSSPNVDLAFAQKNRIRDNLIHLYTIVSGDIEIVVNSLNRIEDASTINTMNAILNNLRNMKDYIYKYLTKNITNESYDEMLQKYITLKRVYDICGEMLKKHFDKISHK